MSRKDLKPKRRKRRVKEPLTDELLQELIDTTDLAAFTRRHHNYATDLPSYLEQLLVEKGKVRAEVVREAGLNETHGYQIFVGTRGASRDKLICIAFALGADLTQTNKLLQTAGVSQLYCKSRRDAIITFCIAHQCSLQTVEEELYRFGEETLGKTQL